MIVHNALFTSSIISLSPSHSLSLSLFIYYPSSLLQCKAVWQVPERPLVGAYSEVLGTIYTHTYIHIYIHTYLIDHSTLGLLRANETNNWNKLNRLRIPTGRRQTSWLCTSVAEELTTRYVRTFQSMGQMVTGDSPRYPSDLLVIKCNAAVI